jgi:hypothetical protein
MQSAFTLPVAKEFTVPSNQAMAELVSFGFLVEDCSLIFWKEESSDCRNVANVSAEPSSG